MQSSRIHQEKQIVQEVSSLEVLAQLVSKGKGLAFVPTFLIHLFAYPGQSKSKRFWPGFYSMFGIQEKTAQANRIQIKIVIIYFECFWQNKNLLTRVLDKNKQKHIVKAMAYCFILLLHSINPAWALTPVLTQALNSSNAFPVCWFVKAQCAWPLVYLATKIYLFADDELNFQN